MFNTKTSIYLCNETLHDEFSPFGELVCFLMLSDLRSEVPLSHRTGNLQVEYFLAFCSKIDKTTEICCRHQTAVKKRNIMSCLHVLREVAVFISPKKLS